MKSKAMRRGAVVVILALVVGVGRPASAANRSAPQVKGAAELLSVVRLWFEEVVSLAFRSPVAPAGEVRSVWGQEGHTIDPNGMNSGLPKGQGDVGATNPNAPLVSKGIDEGHTIDPDG
jgi:hypothetical protein